jgi:hypothetical protein
MNRNKDFERWVSQTYPLMNQSDYIELDYHDLIKFSNWTGLFDKYGVSIISGDKVKVFGQDSEIIWELGAFCYTVPIGDGFYTIPINGSNIVIDSDFKCLEIEKNTLLPKL